MFYIYFSLWDVAISGQFAVGEDRTVYLISCIRKYGWIFVLYYFLSVCKVIELTGSTNDYGFVIRNSPINVSTRISF